MKSRRILYWATSFTLAPLGQALGQTYYVSPTGNDNNTGTSPSSPWQSLAKVDDTTFAPGSQILFQDGGNWYGQQLSASSSGTVAQPITYGSYGSGSNPTFWGSVIVPSTSFQPVSGEADTYFYPTTTPVNAFLVNHQFTDNANLVSGQTTDAGNISYVESTANSSYYDPDGSTPGLYVNTGGLVSSSNVYTTAIVQNVVYSNQQSNLIFKNLTVEESADYNAGYGISIEYSSNVQVLNSTVIAAGKHAVGVIDSTNFLGEGLSASNLMPDQGYGGASAFVSYSDYNVSNTTSQWINDTFTNPNGPYQAFITHTTPSATNETPIASVLVQNLVTDAFPAMTIYTSGNEQVNIVGGQVTNGDVQLDGSNTTLNGMLLTGPYAAIEVGAGGTGNVIENTIINGATPNWEAGRDGAIIDAGTGTLIRYNTIVLGQAAGTTGAAIGLESDSTNSQIYGNIIDTPFAAFFQHDTGTPGINAFDNLFAGTSNPQVIFFYNQSPNAPVTGLPATISANELYGDPGFVDQPNGNLDLAPNSIAAYVFNPTTDEYVMDDFYNNVRPQTLQSLGAIQVAAPSLTWTNATGNGIWNTKASSNWNNGTGAAVYTDLSTIMFNDSNGGSYAVTLNSVVSPGSVVVNNSAGNYTISGTGSIGGSGPLVKVGSGALTISTVNSYSGGTYVGSGTLVAAVNGALPDGAVTVTGAILQLAQGIGQVRMSSLLVSSGGTLNIGNNEILINYGSGIDPITSIAAWIAGGYAGGAWDGPGIMSSAAESNSASYGIGYADAADPGNPAGLAPDTIEIMYTLLGDANLDGKVNGADFTIIAANFNRAVADWDQGDFNYDGFVNGADFTLFAANFNQSAIQSAVTTADMAAIDAFAAANGVATDVPEPVCAGILFISGLGAIQRRRRR